MSVGLIIGLATVHAIICIVYLFLFSKSKFYLALFPIILFIPYLGILLLLLIYLITRFMGKAKKYETEGLFKETEKMEYISEFDEQKEMDIIPVEEALIVNEKNIQRSLVMEVAKRDPEGYLENLKRALLSEDTETAHYAASSITELKRGYDKQLADTERAYKRNPASGYTRREYIDTLDDVLKADLTINKIRQKYIDALVETLIFDIEVSEKSPHSSFDMLIEYLIKTEKYEEAKEWQKKYQQYYSASDRPLRLKLILAFETKDDELFEEAIREVENAKFPITQKTLRMLEFWRGEKRDEKQSV